MQKRIDLSHKDNLNDREQSLRVRDEYLKSMQERLQRQEAESMEERSRLQTLVAKLEMQLREQGRQLEQDRWKVVQDENRVKALQVISLQWSVVFCRLEWNIVYCSQRRWLASVLKTLINVFRLFDAYKSSLNSDTKRHYMANHWAVKTSDSMQMIVTKF